MARICSYGGAKLKPSWTGNRPALLDLIIYVKNHAHLSPTGLLQVSTQLEQLGTSGVSPTALCDGVA